MRLVLSRSLAAALALSLAACQADQPGEDLSTRDGSSDGKALTKPQAATPSLRGIMPLRQSMLLKNEASVGAPAGAKLVYDGGNIVEHPTFVNIFWGAFWASGTGLAERQYLNQFMQTVATSREFASAVEQYTDKNGKFPHPGTFLGEKIAPGEPGKTISNDQIRTAIDGWIQAGIIPPPSLDMLYQIYFPQGTSITLGVDASCTTFCGYHNTVQTTRGTGGLIRYLVEPHPDCAGCQFEATVRDSLTVVSSHEMSETITDPDVGIAIDTNVNSWLGWYDNANGENGDICAGDPNVTLLGFRVQTEWSNADNKCVASRNVAPSPDFSLSASPSLQTVTAGGATSYTLTVAASNGFNSNVSFSVGGAPAGVTAQVAGTVAGHGTATLNVSTTAAASGTSTLTITATSGSLSHSASVSLTVNGSAQPDFAVAVSPGSVSLSAGGSASATVTVSSIGGFTKMVSLSANGLPKGVTASFNPSSVAAGSTTTVTLTADATAPAGSSSASIDGAVGVTTHSAGLAVSVGSNPQPDFNVSVSPSSATVAAGSSAPATVTIGATNGFTGTVTLSASNLPGGVTASFSPATVSGAGTSTVTFTAASSAPSATASVSISGAAGAGAHSAGFSLSVTAAAPADFTIALSPSSAAVSAGGSAASTITVAGSNGFASSVNLAASGAPAGVTVSFDHTTISGSGSATMTVSTSSSMAAGSYPISVSAASGSLRHSASFDLTVNAQPTPGGVVFSDDAESGMGKWSTYTQNRGDPNWAIEKSSASHSGKHRFRSNIGRNYANDEASFMISQAFTLLGARSATLTFFYKYALEDQFDFFYVWASADDGQTWTNIAEGTGLSQGWNHWAPQASLDLSPFAGSSKVRIAFSLQSDFSVTDWGVGLDDIVVTAK